MSKLWQWRVNCCNKLGFSHSRCFGAEREKVEYCTFLICFAHLDLHTPSDFSLSHVDRFGIARRPLELIQWGLEYSVS